MLQENMVESRLKCTIRRMHGYVDEEEMDDGSGRGVVIEEMSTEQQQQQLGKKETAATVGSKVQQQANFRRTWKLNHDSQKSGQLCLVVCLALWAVHFPNFLARLPLWSAFFRSHCASAKVSKVAGVTHRPPTQASPGRQGKPHPASLNNLHRHRSTYLVPRPRFRSPTNTAKSSLR